jgi:hypothetical protein
MTKRMLVGLLTTFFLTGVSHADAQQAKVYRVGVIMQGGPYYEAIDGLRDGLRKLGLQESKDFILEIRDAGRSETCGGIRQAAGTRES